jgi:hypothetical protein
VQPASDIPAAILADMRAAWAALRDEIMAAWTATDRMPWFWWLAESPEVRDNEMPEPEQLARMRLTKGSQQ